MLNVPLQHVIKFDVFVGFRGLVVFKICPSEVAGNRIWAIGLLPLTFWFLDFHVSLIKKIRNRMIFHIK